VELFLFMVIRSHKGLIMGYMVQIDEEVREATAEEEKQIKAQQAAAAKAKKETEAQIAARESALAKLAALGLTEEEIAAL
jgi:DNA-binding NarL/FixJ family response regulator